MVLEYVPGCLVYVWSFYFVLFLYLFLWVCIAGLHSLRPFCGDVPPVVAASYLLVSAGGLSFVLFYGYKRQLMVGRSMFSPPYLYGRNDCMSLEIGYTVSLIPNVHPTCLAILRSILYSASAMPSAQHMQVYTEL